MGKTWILMVTCAIMLSGMEAFACTGLLVGKKASVDGSVMISYAADSHTLYGELYRWPAATWPKGAMLDIIEWDTHKPLGQIPQVEQTYSVVGNMNEHQVAITESTFGGRPELVDTTGIMDYGSLIYVTLQRSKTAREAIRIMTDLVKDYGYYSSGETFSIADKNEAWVMEMIGKGPGNKGAVWVAIRIPDDCISAHANQSRIQQIPFDDKENCIYSPDVVSFAREKGYFSGRDKDFSFQKAYCPYDFSALRGCEARVWSFFRKYDKSMDQYMDLIKGDVMKKPMPLYVKPDRLLSVRDVQNGMRDHFEGTDLDMTKDAGADLYFEKPVDLTYLKLSIQNIFRNRRQLKEHYAKNYYADSCELSSNEQDNKFLKQFIAFIEANMDQSEMDINQIAGELSMSRSKLYTKVKSLTGKSVVEFVLNCRLRKAAKLIIEENMTMREVMMHIGIESQAYFTNSFKKVFGETPTAFAAKHKKTTR